MPLCSTVFEHAVIIRSIPQAPRLHTNREGVLFLLLAAKSWERHREIALGYLSV